MKKVFSVLFAATMVLGLFACGKKTPKPDPDPDPTPVVQTGIGYGLVHGHYVGIIELEVTDGLITDVKLDEVYLPYNWAKVHADYAANEDVLSVAGSRGTSYYAKYINIGGIVFTGEVLGEGTAQSINYKTDTIANIETWVQNNDNAKWYAEQALAGNAFIANANGTISTYAKVDASASKGWLKSTTGYWTVEAPRLGWTGNVAAFAEAIMGTNVPNATLTRASEAAAGEQFWSIGDVVTGSTWTDFPDYYALAQRAFANKTAVTTATTATSYGLVHGHYVGVAHVTKDGGLVTAVELEEYYLPYNWAKVNAALAEDENVVKVVATSRGNVVTTYYAKYLTVGEHLFTIEVSGEEGAQTYVYSAPGIADIETWVQTEANAKYYVEQVILGNVYSATATGARANFQIIDSSASKGWTKSTTGYWTVDAPRLGWSGNVAATIEAVIGTNMPDATLTRASEAAAGEQFWSIGDVVTGATWSDFPDYYNLIRAAFLK